MVSVIQDIKTVSEIVIKLGSIEAQQKLLSIQTEIITLQEINNELRKELADIKAMNELKEQVSFEQNMCWLNTAGKKEGPYCSKCWDEKKKLTHLHSQGVDYICPVCKTYVDTDPDDDVYGVAVPIDDVYK